MSIEININIKGLDQLTEAIALVGGALAHKKGMVNSAKAAVDLMDKVTEAPKEEKTEVKKETKADIKEDVKEDKKEKKAKSKFIREEVRAAFVEKNSPSTRDQLKAILDKFETSNISELEEKHFEDVMKELEAI